MMLFFLLATIVIVFSRNIRGEYVFDDEAAMFDWMEIDKPRGRYFLPDPWEFHRLPRSMARVVYIWICRCSGRDPIGYHMANVGLHAVNTMLLYGIASRLIGPGAGLAATAVFALHPHQVAAVCYISGLPAMLSTFFTFAGLAHFTLYLEGFGTWHLFPLILSQYLAFKSKQDSLVYVIFYLMVFFWHGATSIITP